MSTHPHLHSVAATDRLAERYEPTRETPAEVQP
jgi:hypothetical protein